MNTRVRRFSLLGLVSLPLIAIAVAVIAFGWGFSSTPSTQANTTGGVMDLVVKSGSLSCDNANPKLVTKCDVATGTKVHVSVQFTDLPVGGYHAWATDVNYSGLTYNSVSGEIKATPSALPVKNDAVPPDVYHGDVVDIFNTAAVSTFKGNALNLSFTCATDGPQTITLKPLDLVNNPSGSAYTDGAGTTTATSDALTINCIPAPTSTPIPTRTNTPTPTNTPTLVPIPRMQKLQSVSFGPADPAGDNLANLWLMRQGVKIPPARCIDGSALSAAYFNEQIHIPIGGVDPKNPSQPRQLGGFSFQIKYDPLKVCVILTPGPSWHTSGGGGQICTIQDSVTAPTLQGVASIHCVTLGKSTVVDTSTAAGRILAGIVVKPQPAIYSQAKPNQDNGQAVQLIDEGCKLTDLQAHAIEVFSCESADVTIRYLEGDVEPDCQINTLDTQAIAFRWNSHKGSLIYSDRFNLTPSGTNADQVIDVNDLQFVYGRFGSTCVHPQEGAAPINPKQ